MPIDAPTERELMITGVGGQGVQLAAQVVARAATILGQEVMLFGSYGGMMRGGNTDATIVMSDEPIEAPPVVSETWSAILLHHEYWASVRDRIRDDGVVLVNSSVFEDAVDRDRYTVHEIPATDMATDMGNLVLANMIMVGAYATLTGVIDLESTIAGMRQAVPPYRQQLIEANEAALRAGAAFRDRVSA